MRLLGLSALPRVVRSAPPCARMLLGVSCVVSVAAVPPMLVCPLFWFRALPWLWCGAAIQSATGSAQLSGRAEAEQRHERAAAILRERRSNRILERHAKTKKQSGWQSGSTDQSRLKPCCSLLLLLCSPCINATHSSTLLLLTAPACGSLLCIAPPLIDARHSPFAQPLPPRPFSLSHLRRKLRPSHV